MSVIKEINPCEQSRVLSSLLLAALLSSQLNVLEHHSIPGLLVKWGP